jgi:uncharacterized protein DUF4465/type IX secretion system substrate protein
MMRKKMKLASSAFLGLMLSATYINAQTVSDFENLNLPINSYWNGSDYSGTHINGTFYSTFTSGTAVFPNVYDTAWGAPGYWTQGFAYSNVTDSVTSGFGNLYASKAASGYNNSDNYIVAQNNAVIQLSGLAQNNTVTGMFVTNNTYAANSMRDGDAFAKQFGGATGNDPDWFLLTIKGYTNGNITTDSVNFYLADYRFVDNNQDYIVKQWQWVDLTSLGNVDSLTFLLSSSDTGQWGMNTPAFFCMDNFNDQTVNINELSETNNVNFYPNPTTSFLTITSSINLNSIALIDITGKTILVKNNLNDRNYTINLSAFANGIYFVKYTTENQTAIKKVIKN